MANESKAHGAAAVDAYDRRLRDFNMHLQASRARLASLAPRDDHADDALSRAFEELQVEQEELRVAEEELREQVDELGRVAERASIDRERYRQLFDDAVDGLIVTDLFGIVREVNATAARIFGLEPSCLRGRPVVAFCAFDDRGAVRSAISSASGSSVGSYIDEVVSFEPKNATAFTAALRVGPSAVRDRLVWTLRPLVAEPGDARTSGLYRRSAQVDPARMELDARELLERERRIRQQFERAARAKERFLAVLSHDLRGPLNAVLGWTQFLQREVLDQNARRRAYDTIERSARTQLALIEEVLDISRLAENKLQIDLAPNDAAAIVVDVVEACRPSAAAKGVALETNVRDPLLTTFADRRRLEQVFTNLVGNAIKFTPRGGRIVVDVRRENDDAEIRVRDDGRGIASDLLPHVFEPYRQDECHPGGQGGLGLGLYIARELVELHGGTISAESAGEGHGACFVVRLPLRRVEVASGPSCTSAAHEERDLRGVRVVVVDDDRDTIDIVLALLDDRGAAVAGASDVASALALVDAFDPDVVVSDIGLDGEDGYTLVRRLRERHSGIGYVAMSGFAERRYLEQAFRAGFDMFLVKPVEAPSLVEAILNVSRRRRTSDRGGS